MTYLGATFPLELKGSVKESSSGIVVVQRWKVKTGDQDAFRDQLRGLGYENIEADGQEGTPFHIVSGELHSIASGSVGNETILSDVWSVAFNEEQRTIWVKPIIVQQFASASHDDAILFKADTESFISGSRFYTGPGGAELPLTQASLRARAIAFGANGAVIDQLFDSLKKSVEHFTVSLPVLRRRIVLPRFTTLQPTFGNVGAIFRTSSMLGLESSMPSNLRSAVSSNYPNSYWIRKSPAADQQEDGRWVYSSEYWYAEEETPDPILYPTVI